MTLRYKLRTLLILLAVLPPLLWIGWTSLAAWKMKQERQRTVNLGGNKLLVVIEKVETTLTPHQPQIPVGPNILPRVEEHWRFEAEPANEPALPRPGGRRLEPATPIAP